VFQVLLFTLLQNQAGISSPVPGMQQTQWQLLTDAGLQKIWGEIIKQGNREHPAIKDSKYYLRVLCASV
jgi:hypothetical protein